MFLSVKQALHVLANEQLRRLESARSFGHAIVWLSCSQQTICMNAFFADKNFTIMTGIFITISLPLCL